MYLHSGLNDRPIEMTVSVFSDLIRTRCLQFEPTTEGKPAPPLHQLAIVPPKFNYCTFTLIKLCLMPFKGIRLYFNIT